jgi:hypothetical protein
MSTWAPHGFCRHGHETRKVQTRVSEFISSLEGVKFTNTWYDEFPGEKCVVCDPKERLITYAIPTEVKVDG